MKNETVLHASWLKVEDWWFTSRLQYFFDFVARRSKK